MIGAAVEAAVPVALTAVTHPPPAAAAAAAAAVRAAVKARLKIFSTRHVFLSFYREEAHESQAQALQETQGMNDDLKFDLCVHWYGLPLLPGRVISLLLLLYAACGRGLRRRSVAARRVRRKRRLHEGSLKMVDRSNYQT